MSNIEIHRGERPVTLVKLGTNIKGWGVVTGIRYDGFERFYFITDDNDKNVTMLPELTFSKLLEGRD